MQRSLDLALEIERRAVSSIIGARQDVQSQPSRDPQEVRQVGITSRPRLGLASSPSAVVQRREGEGLWDANDVAVFLKASRSWVYEKAESGQLPSVKIGGLLRFNPAAIRRLVFGDET